ncbi:hypothetical protein EMIHUDRAFT_469999 [Emiliania huxleyi CCMP1516]|nr:hypothetical protein EMIHUDRAFT_469999 [Emiliania huxleyi CCMP1516]EOD20165.1 hypothetical protein EMIHUDRAFT_469999 [Emiliania huxleyi CCMP1516]|eukprot:XP_005772594.1 hypothetical protein EMIHUDRAFT_469999 [Emiliania huxleyi CCMP1516]
MAQRVKNHEERSERNLARKLTPAQRREKKRRKMLNDPSGGGTPVTLYRIHTVPNKQKLYKIDINAQQNHLTGAQRRYRKLLLHRIDWTDFGAADDDDDEDDEEEARRRAQSEVCQVVWEGLVVKPQFKNFRVEAARSSEGARKMLAERGCAHYWDMARTNGAEGVPEEDEDEDEDEDEEAGSSDEGEGEGEEERGAGAAGSGAAEGDAARDDMETEG